MIALTFIFYFISSIVFSPWSNGWLYFIIWIVSYELVVWIVYRCNILECEDYSYEMRLYLLVAAVLGFVLGYLFLRPRVTLQLRCPSCIPITQPPLSVIINGQYK
jgi:hypothetical protein